MIRELTFDEAEELGLDGTLRSGTGNPHIVTDELLEWELELLRCPRCAKNRSGETDYVTVIFNIEVAECEDHHLERAREISG
jgi:hypothetical protein